MSCKKETLGSQDPFICMPFSSFTSKYKERGVLQPCLAAGGDENNRGATCVVVVAGVESYGIMEAPPVAIITLFYTHPVENGTMCVVLIYVRCMHV